MDIKNRLNFSRYDTLKIEKREQIVETARLTSLNSIKCQYRSITIYYQSTDAKHFRISWETKRLYLE